MKLDTGLHSGGPGGTPVPCGMPALLQALNPAGGALATHHAIARTVPEAEAPVDRWDWALVCSPQRLMLKQKAPRKGL